MKKSRSVYSLVFLLAVFLSRPQQLWSQGLPQPSGKFGIGYYRFEWTDSSRIEILAAYNTPRRIAADVWYPAENSVSKTVPYLDTIAINRAFGNIGLQSLLDIKGAALVKSVECKHMLMRELLLLANWDQRL